MADDLLYQFTAQDIQYLSQFLITNLPPPPPSLSNQFADEIEVAKFGQQLFFDQRLSANGKVSCAHCHQPERYFTDGLKVARGIKPVKRNAPSLLGAAYGPWKYWDGRKDSLWSQALAPIEDPHEQGLNRFELSKLVRRFYRYEYERLFGLTNNANSNLNSATVGPLTVGESTTIFVNVGKAIMAYERQLTTPPSPLDHFLLALEQKNSEAVLQSILSPNQVSGLRLFVGKAGCVSCHNGPLLTNFEFHNVGVPESNLEQVDLGRYQGIEKLRADEFTCLSDWSDADETQCVEMQYLKAQGQELVGAFKTPSLRNVEKTAPYMHGGQFETLEAVIDHYNKPTPPVFVRDQHPFRPHFDIRPLNLSEQEQTQILAFLKALTSPIPENDPWWQVPE